MSEFRTVLFNGYEKKKVDEYLSFLVKEMRELKESTNEALEEQENRVRELEQELKTAREEKAEAEKKLFEVQREYRHFKEDSESQKELLEDKIARYEGSYEAVSHLLNTAKGDAEKLVKDAKKNASEIEEDAHTRAEEYRKQAESEIQEQRKENERTFSMAKFKLAEYLNSINQSQTKLIETYNELGELVKKMPLRIGDIFSENPMELLAEKTGEAADSEK